MCLEETREALLQSKPVVYQEEFRENFESSEKKHDKKRSEPKS
jgi:hypothetical protein